MATQERQLPIDIMKSALTVGALSGGSGLLFGSVAGILRSPHPVIFALAASGQWFALGTTFWGSRSIVLNTWYSRPVSPRHSIYASGIAGGLSGGIVAALTRGRANVVPGIIVFSIFGSLSQAIYNSVDASRSTSFSVDHSDTPSANFLQNLASKKWIPMKSLSDKEYEGMLREKLLKVEVEMAVIDDDIKKLKAKKDSKLVETEMLGKE